MAQNLLKFETENDYRIAKINHLIVPHICYVKESGKTYISGIMANKMDAEAGDIIAFNVGDGSMVFIKPEAFTAEMNRKYTPVAVVVVPPTHTEDNKVVGMSLKAMSASTPTLGSVTTSGIEWGTTTAEAGGHDYVVCINLEDNNNPSATIANSVKSFLPSDKFYCEENAFDNIVDLYTKWNEDAGTYTPSPYLLNGSQSGRYVTTDLNNAFSDMGRTYLTSQDETAANICAQFNVPVYMGVGQWYLPPIGELGYLIVRAERISYALQQIRKADRSLAALLDDNGQYWSATLNTSHTEAWCASLKNGFIARASVSNQNFVRAFARF